MKIYVVYFFGKTICYYSKGYKTFDAAYKFATDHMKTFMGANNISYEILEVEVEE